MSQADELLDDITEHYAGTSYDLERHIVIDRNRFIYIPEELKKIAVQFDHMIETITFDCPRFWDEHDMSKMRIYVNYMRSDDEQGADLATNVVVDETDEEIMHFDWTITGHLTEVFGPITFLVCVKKVGDDGTEANHWNSELCTDAYVSRGMECEANIIAHYPGIITSVLARMDYVEKIATPETMQNYVNDYLDKNPDTPDIIRNYLYNYMSTTYPTTEEAMQEYISMYIEKHPFLFVIGSEKPGVKSLWFRTTGEGTAAEIDTVKLVAETDTESVYAEVEDTVVPARNFDIL